MSGPEKALVVCKRAEDCDPALLPDTLNLSLCIGCKATVILMDSTIATGHALMPICEHCWGKVKDSPKLAHLRRETTPAMAAEVAELRDRNQRRN